MCYYNGQALQGQQEIRLKQFEAKLNLSENLGRPLISGFDYGESIVLKRKVNEEGFEIAMMEWGFIPQYLATREEVAKMRTGYRDKTGKFKPPMVMLNAVGEEILMPGKIFRDAALTRRCLIISTGFYEWRHVYPVNKKTGQPLKTAKKYPYFISLKERPYFFMAGVWQPWTDRDTGEYVESFAIVTTAANSLMAQIHNSKRRMPLLLDEAHAFEWLLGDPDEKRLQEIVRYQYPEALFEYHTIPANFRELPEPRASFEYADLPPIALA
ncbi:MAG TPA: SOS response-associated peptidase family protein [Ginsengibacter sp.]|nr:SOS response-associated peptidase family protein [Ginsengibacter sp.]HRP18504.1 SOS response-associated peptidase family protein [Ginsengibacter sp.]HRP44556.1 SOS response-associated peptidase family protein [Ginsengibacter sp.]